MIIVCDTFDSDDYPVYVSMGDTDYSTVQEAIEHYDGKNMQRVMEVYDLRLNREQQINEILAWHL